jgi:hypothetical protein
MDSNNPYHSHYSPHNFPDHMLMVPGTQNLQCNSSSKEHEVHIIQTWDGNRPKIDLLLDDFQTYLLALKVYRRTKEVNARTRSCYFS